MSTILDTSAWIELFLGTEKGKRVAHVLATDLCYSSISTLSEIVNWASKERLELSALINIVEKNSLVIELDKEAAILAGKLNFERKKINKKWGMLDSFVLAVSLIHNLRILTKDLDFKDLPGAEIL
jgi:predicted nucleic acid-binding protein